MHDRDSRRADHRRHQRLGEPLSRPPVILGPGSYAPGELPPCCDDHDVHFSYGPLPWLWCHEQNFGHDDDEECLFLIGCNLCGLWYGVEGQDPELWERWRWQHRHPEVAPLPDELKPLLNPGGLPY